MTTKPESVSFNIRSGDEHSVAKSLNPKYREYLCGSCGINTSGRVLCNLTRSLDGATLLWCLCSCQRQEPAIITVEKDGVTATQFPQAKQFSPGLSWPKDIADLYDEASKSFSATAFTSASMICRKILMCCVCHEQEAAKETPEEGKPFTYYVDYLSSKILNFPKAKTAIDAIRSIGNEANHHVAFVTEADAARSMTIIRHLMDAIYSLPNA